VHGRNGEVGLSHLLGQPVDLSLGVAEDDGLGDGEAEGRKRTRREEGKGVARSVQFSRPQALRRRLPPPLQPLAPPSLIQLIQTIEDSWYSRIVKITQRIELPILLLDGDEELLDSLERQLITLDKDPDRVGHELGGHLEDVVREGGRENDDLRRGREVSVDVVDLVLESLVEELIGLIEDEHLVEITKKEWAR